VVAGVSVALVLIPQSLAYAVLAGVSPHHGLYAAILPPIAAAFFASSAFLQTGPVAMTSLLTLGALTPLAAPFTAEYAALAALLALIVGAVRLTVGVTGTGIIAYLLSQPVIVGFTLAAEVLIVFSQLPAALGMTAPGTGILADAWWAVGAVADWNLAAIGLSFLTGVLVIGGRRVHAVFPGVLVAVVLGTALAAVFGYHGPTLGELPSVLPRLSVAMPWSRLPDLFVPGLVIALVGFVDAAAVGRLMAAKTRQRWDPDREFVSQGIANLASGVANGFPVGGSFGRSLLAASAGARTRWTGAIAGLTVLAFLPAAGVLARLPNAILAAAIIATVAKVVDVRSLTGIHRHSRPQAAIAWTTFALTLLLAPRIEQAILVGIGLGVAVHLWRERKVEIRRRMDGKTLHLEPMGVLFFGSAPQLDDAFIAELAANPDAERLVLDLRHLGRIDYAGALLVQRVAQAAEQAGLDVRITGLPPRGGGVLRRVLGEQNRWLQPAPEG
jgi:SulP family sulfate permease